MENQPLVILLGESVLMDSIATSLFDMHVFDIVRINSDLSTFDQLENHVPPALIVYEHDTKFTKLIHRVLSQQPDTLMLAIDLYSNQVMVLDCQLHSTQSMHELCDLIHEEVQRYTHRNKVS